MSALISCIARSITTSKRMKAWHELLIEKKSKAKKVSMIFDLASNPDDFVYVLYTEDDQIVLRATKKTNEIEQELIECKDT